MRPSETIYRGERLFDGQLILGVRVTVDGRELHPARSLRLRQHSPTGFEWGYTGSGPAQLALALVLDATGDPRRALAAYQWFKWATVANWGESWEITAGEIAAWLLQLEREDAAEARYAARPAAPVAAAVRRCQACGCSDADCSRCVAVTGAPCGWSATDPELCTRCAGEEAAIWVRDLFGAEGGAA